jgi:hypothetical protein
VKTPDIPGDPRPPRDSPEYTRWYHRNVAGPKAQAAKAALAEAQKHERAQAEQVKRHIKAIEAAKTAEERVHLVGETLLDAAHSEALLINAARGEVFSILERRLDSNQRELRKWFQHAQTKGRRLVLNASRQQGKSFWAVAEALTFCFLNPKAQVKYGAPSKIQTRGIVMPHIRDLLDGDFSKGVPGVPMHLRPKWVAEDSSYLFPNGAVLTIIACDEAKADSITGQHAHLFFIDEAGQIDNLDFIVRDIARPMLMNTRGHMLIFSTPPRSKGNSFRMYCGEAKEKGLYCFRDIFDNPRLTDDEIKQECEDAGGVHSTTWKREYLCEFVTDEETAVLPEATAERTEAITITDEVLRATRSPFVDPYVVVKPGWNPNFTGVLFGHYDFRLKRAVVENELVIRKMDSALLHQSLGEKLLETWGEGAKPFRSLGPIEDKLLVEMHTFGWKFSSPPIDLTDVDINKLRHSIAHVRGPKLFLHERCTATRRQFENAVWNKKRTGFEPHRDDGRYELVTAGIHFRQAINEKHDPTPKGLALHPSVGITIPLNDPRHTKLAQSVRKWLGVRRA